MKKVKNITISAKEVIARAEAALHLSGIANNILPPDYELRRFRDKKLGKDGILMPLAPKDWETLTTAYGPMAIEARFTALHAPKKQRLVYPTRR